MSTRMIATSLWTDKEFRKIKSIKTRYLWIYLLSCPMSKICGIFHLPLDIIAFESKLSEEDIEKSLQELEVNNFVYYDKESEEIAIYNYPKYNISNMGKPMVDCITRELDLVSNKNLVSRVIQSLRDYQKTLGNERKMETVESIIEVYSLYLPESELNLEKEKTIFKERVLNTNTNITTNTTTNSDTIHDSYNDSYSDTPKQENKIEKRDWANADPNEKF